MNFSLEQLLAFVTVYEQLSFSKAATELNKHRTTIGQVITNLEDQLAVTLFERIGRSVEPTEDGRLLYRYAKQAIEHAKVFDRMALSLSFGGLEKIRIAYPSYVPHKVLSLIRKQLAETFPTMKVDFVVRNREEVVRGILEGEYHFGVVNSHNSMAIHSLDTVFLGHTEFVPFAKKGGTIHQSQQSEILGVLQTERQFMLRSLIDEGLGNKFIVSGNNEDIDQLALVVKMIKEDLGWAWLPRSLSQSELVIEDLAPIDVPQLMEGFKVPLTLCCQHSKVLKPIKQVIVSTVSR
ncbi:TPA: LysR family transcriptional regulator [Vibrio vulnificus]|nr:LysR family transcriptional regulator [Vibrio vulnificus]HDY7435692.1 LysR family transcriptional regulator [Vibrio vulnificus]